VDSLPAACIMVCHEAEYYRPAGLQLLQTSQQQLLVFGRHIMLALLLQVARDYVKGVAGFTRDYKTFLSLFSTTNLAFIVWQTLSGARSLLVQQAFVNILYVILLAIAQHLLYLAINYAVCWWVANHSLCAVIAPGQGSACCLLACSQP
jgi:hypothetical protein